MTDDLKLVEALRSIAGTSTAEWIAAPCLQAASAIERLVRERDAAQGTADDVYRTLMPRAEKAEAERDRLAKLVADMREALNEVLRTGLNGGNNVRLAMISASGKELSDELLAQAEASERATVRARALLQRTQEQP